VQKGGENARQHRAIYCFGKPSKSR
jgi:hypothetical protein